MHEFFGGEVYSLPLDGGGRHSFDYINGVFVDLASEQFGRDALPDFSLAEPVDQASLLSGGDKAERCALLRERLLTVLAKHGKHCTYAILTRGCFYIKKPCQNDDIQL